MNLDLIRSATKKNLGDADWLEGAIKEIGSSTARTAHDYEGCGAWQWPTEMAPYLVALSKLKVRSYAEIGIWHGGGFAITVEYLKRFGLQVALGIDMHLRESAISYAHDTPGTVLIQAESNEDVARYAVETLRPDLVFIDADHSYATAKHDWELARSAARHVAFHDIHWPGVDGLWAEIDLPKKEWWDEELNSSGTGLVKVA